MRERKQFLNIVRDHLGLTQLEMAEYLNIDRAQLAMIESGKRPLAIKFVMELSKFLHPSGKPFSVPKATELLADKEAVKKLANYKKETEWKLLKLKKLLASLQNKNALYRKKLTGLQQINEFLNTSSESKEILNQKINWVKDLERKAIKDFINCNMADINILEIKIASLEYELGAVKNSIEALKHVEVE